MTDFETSKKQIAELVEEFKRHEHYYTSNEFDEENAKSNFINKFFIALGWDVNNDLKVAPQYRDVVFEDKIVINGKTKAPDYSFGIGADKSFFVEAKAPHENIENSKEHAFQLKRYTWSAKLPVGLLTDFEELAIYVPRSTPKKSDHPDKDKIEYYRYTDYVDNWKEIYDIYSRDAVLSGDFDNYFSDRDTKGYNPTTTVDDDFLKKIEEWRSDLARNIALRNKDKNLDEEDINFAVQSIIDRIIFLRIAEDRGIEKYGQLRELTELAKNNNRECPVYDAFIELCKKADLKYNSGLFHFTEEKDFKESVDNLTPNLHVDDGKLKAIIKNLYYPDSPYEFSVLSTEILGNIYEQFLGKVIRLTDGGYAKIEEKPEVKKAGGVYYTPQYIVEYMVDNALDKLLKNKTPNQVKELKILDPACGSGSFLLGAYQKLLDWHLEYYSNLEKPPSNAFYIGKGKIPHLTIQEKKRILLNNIYGVDIDSQAVEVTKLSLLLKVLEGENKDIFESQQTLIQERALPDLGNNIRCGNSIIDLDMVDITKLSSEEVFKLNPFDWIKSFPKVFADGGFDVIIGNPPYVGWADMENRSPLENGKYYHLKYRCRPNHDDAQPNIYMFFLIKSLKLIKPKGKISYILPQEWIYQVQDFRDDILKKSGEIEILKFNPDLRIFKNREGVVGTNSLILTITQNNKNKLSILELNDLNENNIKNTLNKRNFDSDGIISHKSQKSRFLNKRWQFYNPLIEKILSKSSSKYISFDNKNYFKVLGGFQPNVELSKKYIITNTDDLNDFEKNFVYPCIYNSNSLKRYYINDEGQYWVVLNGEFDFEEDFKNKCPNLYNLLSSNLKTNKKKWWEFPNVRNLKIIQSYDEKLFSPRTASENSFSYDNEYHVTKGTNSIIISEVFNIKYVLAILNSNLATYFYKEYGFSYHGTKTKKFEPNNIKNFMIPIKKIDDKSQQIFVELVDKMIDLKKQMSISKNPQQESILELQFNSFDEKINELVYGIYDFSDEEIKTIEETLRNED